MRESHRHFSHRDESMRSGYGMPVQK
jgi:hypothetical protein